jgi:hypothetical protein
LTSPCQGRAYQLVRRTRQTQPSRHGVVALRRPVDTCTAFFSRSRTTAAVRTCRRNQPCDHATTEHGAGPWIRSRGRVTTGECTRRRRRAVKSYLGPVRHDRKVTKKYPLILIGSRLRRVCQGVCGPPGARTQNLQVRIHNPCLTSLNPAVLVTGVWWTIETLRNRDVPRSTLRFTTGKAADLSNPRPSPGGQRLWRASRPIRIQSVVTGFLPGPHR